ncbi:uncharacterized protein RAG0_14790 [Rhynchosporium agropyri]|uniref:Uncharacterized protein n=1 Tax=Rhynchosporium agropyri TaxID=914238 RepID=A0A1E1LIL6_9HELO|nr:uncharacterized protein RAG0_14790 [Rhynchosporium agropyri]
MSTTPTSEAIKAAVAELGFYQIQDPTLGLRIEEMEKKGSQRSISSEAGLEFCISNVVEDQRIRTLLESFFRWCGLGYYQSIAEDQGHIFQFRKGVGQPDILLVQLWSKGSRVVYYGGSHLIPWFTVRAANRLWEIPLAALTREGIGGTEIFYEHGGLAILDARVAFEMKHGSPITCGFAVQDQLKTWPKLVLPKSEESARRVAELDTRTIGVHI